MRQISTKCFESVNFFPKHAIIIGDYAQEKDRRMKAVATPELEIEKQLIQQLTSGESQWTYREDLKNEDQ